MIGSRFESVAAKWSKQMDHKCKKITIEFTDMKMVLEGKDAQEWHDYVQGMATCCSVHQRHFPDLKWKEVKDGKPSVPQT